MSDPAMAARPTTWLRSRSLGFLLLVVRKNKLCSHDIETSESWIISLRVGRGDNDWSGRLIMNIFPQPKGNLEAFCFVFSRVQVQKKGEKEGGQRAWVVQAV